MPSAEANCEPCDRQPTMRMVAMLSDNNPTGEIFGGWLMSQIDVAGSIAAIERADGDVVTRAVTSLQFVRPLFVGDLISLYATVQKIGTTSVTVEVEVFARRYHDRKLCEKISEALVVYVAVDNERRPRPLT